MLRVLRRAPRILGLLCAVVVAPLPAEALDVGDQVLWGFDNKVVPGCVNPLSVRVFNDTPRPFDGKLELERHWGGDRQTVVVEDCYVSPYTERWVQFYVYVAGGRGGWSLTWGRRADDRMDLEGPKMAAPACVLLADSAATGAGQAQLPLFPADLFPSSVAATKGLHGIVMDAAPAWELPRRRAFLDWLKRGGTLHLIHGTDGRFPRFSEDLSELNGKGNRQRNREPEKCRESHESQLIRCRCTRTPSIIGSGARLEAGSGSDGAGSTFDVVLPFAQDNARRSHSATGRRPSAPADGCEHRLRIHTCGQESRTRCPSSS